MCSLSVGHSQTAVLASPQPRAKLQVHSQHLLTGTWLHRLKKNETGRNIFYGGAGSFTGYSDGLDTAAWGEVEDMTYAESYAKLPVIGSATFSHYGSGLTHANMRKILEQNLNRDIK